MRLLLLVVALVAFTGWSVWWIHDEGLIGLVHLLRDNDWGAQVFVDLCIALTVAWAFMAADARRLGLRLWPWLVATPFVGSIAVLSYLIRRELHLRSSTSTNSDPG